MKIEITIKAGTASADWARVADKNARAAATEAGIAWKDANVYVTLPEAGRCMTKTPGYTQLTAHG